MTQRPLAAFLLAILLAVPVFAQDPKLPDARVFDKLVVDSLRDVHNRGADLYNTKKQFEGAYRVYEGALVTIRPLLAHRPQAQKIIDDGFAAAEKEPVMALKAFKLHEAIEAVRTHLKNPDAATKKEPDPKPKDKTEPKPKDKTEPKPKDKKDVKPSAGGKAKGSKTRISGGVTFKGQPVKAGEVTLVTLDQAKPRVFTIAIAADGTYAFPELPPGRYVVIVTAPGVPAKYQTTTTSGLVIEVPAGATVQHLELK